MKTKKQTIGDLIKNKSTPEEVQIIPPNSISPVELKNNAKDVILVPIVSYKSSSPVKLLPGTLDQFNRAFSLKFDLNTEFIYYICLLKLIIAGIPYYMVRFAFGVQGFEPIMNSSIYNTLQEALQISSTPSKLFTKSEVDVYQFEKDKVKTVDEITNEIDVWLKQVLIPN